MVAVIGPSGAGKSTLFKALVNAINVKNGQITLFNSNTSNWKRKDWAKNIKKIGFLTQKPNLINTENVYDNVKRAYIDYDNFFFKMLGILSKKQKFLIAHTLDELGILDKIFYRVSDLSGGQQQRVEIAKLLVRNVDLILADEPTSNLDNQTSIEVLNILQQLKHKGKTILVNIHDLSLIKENFDRVIAINNQQIILDKTTDNIEQWELQKAVTKMV